MAKRSFVLDDHLNKKVNARMLELDFSEFSDYMRSLIRKDLKADDNELLLRENALKALDRAKLCLEKLERLATNEEQYVEVQASKVRVKRGNSQALRELISVQEAKIQKKLKDGN